MNEGWLPEEYVGITHITSPRSGDGLGLIATQGPHRRWPAPSGGIRARRPPGVSLGVDV